MSIRSEATIIAARAVEETLRDEGRHSEAEAIRRLRVGYATACASLQRCFKERQEK